MSPIATPFRPSIVGAMLRPELNLDDFDKLIYDYGYCAKWSKSSLCPNRDPKQPDHHRINCTFCDTTGFIYYDPIDVRVLATSYANRQIFMPESRYEPGTAYFTFQSEYKVSFWDKIELLASVARFSQVLTTKGTTYKLKYPALVIDMLRDSGNVEIDPASAAVDILGQLVLAAAPVGEFFTVVYTYHPAYIVLDLMHQIRDSRATINEVDAQHDFPRQVMARLDFLVRDEGRDE